MLYKMHDINVKIPQIFNVFKCARENLWKKEELNHIFLSIDVSIT